MLSILGTYRCTAACEHCCFDSNPLHKQQLSLDQITSFIDEATHFRSLKVVVFSGGECFLLGDDLNKAIEFAVSKGLKTRCVTNGYWAQSIEAGRKRLESLKESGLTELNISTGDHHQQFVDEETVVNAVQLGTELGIPTVVMVELQLQRRVTAETLMRNSRFRELRQKNPEVIVLESPWMPTEFSQQISQRKIQFLNHDTLPSRHGCDSIFSTIVLTPYKKLGFCCGLSRERLPELNVDLENDSLFNLLTIAGRDFIKIWLFVDGPEKIIAWAASKNPEIDWENHYAHHCHACLAVFDDPKVRTTIKRYYGERVDDVLLRYSMTLRQQELLEGAVYS
jgi:hypothetical protein